MVTIYIIRQSYKFYSDYIILMIDFYYIFRVLLNMYITQTE